MRFETQNVEEIMQKKNDTTKLKIKDSAKQLFSVMSYKDASMRDVAKMSNMTVGNIYRYYENKEVLFEDIVGEAYEKLKKLIKITDLAQKFIKNKIGINEKNVYKNSKFKAHMIDKIAEFVTEYRAELYILMHNSEGSKYETTTEQIEKMVKETIVSVIPNIDTDRVSVYTFTALSTFSFMLKKYMDDKAKLCSEIKLFIDKLFNFFI